MNIEIDDNPIMGRIEIIIGPAFDVRSFNWGINGNESKGILPKKERGVLSMDAQWNALNFVYFVPRALDSYERKFCTNRLSFFIEPKHGERAFPENIESQLSLLVFRDKRVRKNGETNQRLLAIAVKKAIPMILQSVVLEILYRDKRETALESRIDHAIRTYLLLHQV